jgi:hypothetical protein
VQRNGKFPRPISGQTRGLPPRPLFEYPGNSATTQQRGNGHEGINILLRSAKQKVDPFVTIPSVLLSLCPGFQNVALGEAPGKGPVHSIGVDYVMPDGGGLLSGTFM